MGVPGSELPVFGISFVSSLVWLVVVCMLALLGLRWLGRRGIERGDASIRIRGRCALEARRALYIVETAGRCFLVGAGEGPLSLLAEIDPAALPRGSSAAASVAWPRFSELLAKLARRRRR